MNDEMVALLKSGRINNRLLCELATHKDFIKFLADIEIYVDGIATMQIQNLNALVDTVRHEIIERYRPCLLYTSRPKEDLPDNGGGFLVHQQVVFVLRVFPIPKGSHTAGKLALLGFRCV